ncbi:MAG: hypothetical protein H6512_00850 [Acidimicrobiia bacterium]|nr:hypothetical protein [Acidimicrobiia bacterium]
MDTESRRLGRLPGMILALAAFLSVFAGLSVASSSASELSQVRTATTTDGGVSFFRLPQPFEAGIIGVSAGTGDAQTSVLVRVRSAVSERFPAQLKNAAAADAHAALTWSDSWQDVATQHLSSISLGSPDGAAAGGADPSQVERPGNDAADGDQPDSDVSDAAEGGAAGSTTTQAAGRDIDDASTQKTTGTGHAGSADAVKTNDVEPTDSSPVVDDVVASSQPEVDQDIPVVQVTVPAQAPVSTTPPAAPPVPTPTTTPVTVPQTTAPASPTARSGGQTPQQVVDQALTLINYPWQTLGVRIDAYGPNPSLAGEAFTDHIDIYVSPDQTVADVAWIIAHEMGHVVDYRYNDTARRAEYLSLRGVGGLSADYQSWTGGGPGTTRAAASEDYADVFAIYLMGNLNWTSSLAPRTSQAEAQTFERFFWP